MQAMRVAGGITNNPKLDAADAEAIVTEAGRFAAEVLSPLNRVGDAHGVKLANKSIPPLPVGEKLISNGAKRVGAASTALKALVARTCQR